MNKVLDGSSSQEYFKDLVERAVSRQGLHTSEMSCYYIVQLLDSFVQSDPVHGETPIGSDGTLAEMICQAMSANGARRLRLLRLTGDSALFVAGFFADSLRALPSGVEYYVRMGGSAYAHAAAVSPRTTSSLFTELAAKFVRFVDVLNEVSETSLLSKSRDRDLLRLYDRWLQTGSRRAEALLRREGILLESGSKRVH